MVCYGYLWCNHAGNPSDIICYENYKNEKQQKYLDFCCFSVIFLQYFWNTCMQHKQKQAFILIELMVVIVIITLMMIIWYAPYNFYQQKAKVKIAGREIAQSIYEAKNLAISGKAFDDSGKDKNQSIGIVFEKGENTIKYYRFDILEVTDPPNIPNIDASNVPFKKKSIQTGVEFLQTETSGQQKKDTLFLFFEAITGKIYVDKADYSWKHVKINYKIKNSTNINLKGTIKYYPKTNTTFYKTKN